MISQTQDGAYKDCRLEILNQPLENISIRYATEGNKRGKASKCGGTVIYSNKEKKEYPKVQITNCNQTSSKIYVQCSLSTVLSTADSIRGPHLHQLKRNSPYEEQEEFITQEVSQNKTKQLIAIFADLKVTKTKEEDYWSFYQKKFSKFYKGQSQLCSKYVEAIKSKQKMCLKFQAFIVNEETEEKTDIGEPVFSRVINITTQRQPQKKGGQRKSCSDNEAQSIGCSSKKKRRKCARGKENSDGIIQPGGVKKIIFEASPENCGINVASNNPTIEENYNQELSSIQDSEKEIGTNVSSFHPVEICDETSLLRQFDTPADYEPFPPDADENSLSSPEIPDEIFDLLPNITDESDVPEFTCEDSCLSLENNYDYYLDGNLDYGFKFESSETPLPLRSEVTVGMALFESMEEEPEIIAPSDILPDALSILRSDKGMKDYYNLIAHCEAGGNSSLCGVFKNLWKSNFILLVLLLTSLHDMRIGAMGLCILSLKQPKQRNEHLTIFCSTLHTILRTYALIFVCLFSIIVYKLIIMILDSKVIRCILRLLYLLFDIFHFGFPRNIFDDRYLHRYLKNANERRSDRFKEETKMFHLRKLMTMILHLRRKGYDPIHINTYHLKKLYCIMFCGICFYYFIISS